MKNVKLQNVRGTKDLFGADLDKFNNIINVAKGISFNYGFKELLTPIFEFSEVFERNLGDDSDIISKEVYKFPDRGDNSLTLRPEFTACVVRSFINNGELNQVLPQKFFSSGPVFRYDRPQKGRQRQFHQINCELIGISDIGGDVEAILLAHHILQDLGLSQKVTLQINSLGSKEVKAKYEVALKEYFSKHKEELSDDSKRRLEENPLRILDSKDKGDNVICVNAPQINDFYDSKTKQDFSKILNSLDKAKITYEVNPRLVRGLDYYTSTVFEFVTNDLGAQNTVLAGGRYDDLIAKMGGNDIPAIGFAGGIERLILLSDFDFENERPIQVIYVSDDEYEKAFEAVNDLRKEGVWAEISYSSNMKKQWKKADQNNAKIAIIIGGDEVKNDKLKVKYLDESREIEVPTNELLKALRK
jgi:histidyl-tRNA synthetase